MNGRGYRQQLLRAPSCLLGSDISLFSDFNLMVVAKPILALTEVRVRERKEKILKLQHSEAPLVK